MLLACKYEEISVPVVEDLIQISDRAYTREEVLEMVIIFFFLFHLAMSVFAVIIILLAICFVVLCNQERLMVNTLQFNMSVPTPYVFMRRFLKAADSDKKVCIVFFVYERTA